MKRPLFLQSSRLPPSKAYLFCCRKWIMSSDFLTQLWGSSAVPWAPSPLYGYRKGLPSGWLRLEQYIPCWNASCHRASLGSWSNWVNSFGLGEKKQSRWSNKGEYLGWQEGLLEVSIRTGISEQERKAGVGESLRIGTRAGMLGIYLRTRGWAVFLK